MLRKTLLTLVVACALFILLRLRYTPNPNFFPYYYSWANTANPSARDATDIELSFYRDSCTLTETTTNLPFSCRYHMNADEAHVFGVAAARGRSIEVQYLVTPQNDGEMLQVKRMKWIGAKDQPTFIPFVMIRKSD